MLENNPHVKYIRICERLDLFGKKIDALIIDTDIQIIKDTDIKKDFRLIELAANIKEFQISFRKEFGTFRCIEVMGSKSLLLNTAA